jgi:serine/threonine-protein kinase
MVLVPAGEYPRGDNREPRYQPSYLLDVWPLTNERYHAFVKATGHEAPEEWNDPDYRLPNQPVTGVSWEDAAAYADWVGKRLATEDEWEKAARGIPGRLYPWGKSAPDETRANYGHNIGHPSPVNQHLAGRSPYGCVDMAGNVLEWCADWFMEDRGTRVLRGGSWVSGPNILRTTYRYGDTPTYRYPIFGFRCALSWPASS